MNFGDFSVPNTLPRSTASLIATLGGVSLLPINLLNSFKSKIKNENNILIARSNGKIHPVVGLWNINLLDKLKKELQSDNRKIMNWVSKNKYDFVDFPVHDYDPFFNINTKEDLIEAERIEKISHLS